MDSAKQRVEQELVDLRDKISRLHHFTLTPACAALAPAQIALLKTQVKAMDTYAEILRLRLEAW